MIQFYYTKRFSVFPYTFVYSLYTFEHIFLRENVDFLPQKECFPSKNVFFSNFPFCGVFVDLCVLSIIHKLNEKSIGFFIRFSSITDKKQKNTPEQVRGNILFLYNSLEKKSKANRNVAFCKSLQFSKGLMILIPFSSAT